jgi:hypothetical protein
MLDMLSTICLRLSQAHDQLLMLAFDKTMERLVRKVLELAEESGDSTSEGTGIAHYIKQEELAQMIAAPREVVSSLLNELRAMDLIAYSAEAASSSGQSPYEPTWIRSHPAERSANTLHRENPAHAVTSFHLGAELSS